MVSLKKPPRVENGFVVADEHVEPGRSSESAGASAASGIEAGVAEGRAARSSFRVSEERLAHPTGAASSAGKAAPSRSAASGAPACASDEPAIAVSHLSKVFGTRRAVDDVSFSLPQGSFLSIFGPNGAGKTTLLRMLSTLSRPTSGTACLMGINLKDEPDKARDHIGLISHNAMLYPDLTAQENLMLYARLYGVVDPQARVMELLEAVELKHRRLDVVRTFSRGMTQRLSIARALIHDPDVVFLDEPYSGLDPHAMDIFDGLIESQREGRTFVMVSHDLRKGFDMCTHALVLARGRIVAFDEKANLDFDEFSQLYRDTVGMGVA